MSTIEIIYITASALSICGSVPQVKQLLKTKRSDELSTMTWFVWTISQVVAMCYAVSIHAPILILTNAVWVSFYTVMIILIYHYRAPKTLQRSYEYINVSNLDESVPRSAQPLS